MLLNNMTRNKDEGYSWLVLVSATLSQLMFGTFTFGVLSVLTYIWVEKFSISTDRVAWASSILGAVLLLTGPLMAVILHSIGSWKTQLIGSLVSLAAGFALAFSTQFWHIIITYSIFQAFGFAMTQIATIDIIGNYFDRHKDKIYAGLWTSFCVGFLVGPVMVEALLSTLGYQRTFLVMAAISALNLPSGFIYRGPQCYRKKSTEKKPNCQQSELDTVSKQVDSQSSSSDTEKSSANLRMTEIQISAREKLRKIAKQHMKVLKQPLFLLVLLHYILSMAGENSFFALCVDFFVQKDVLTLAQAALGMTLCGVSAVAGSTLLAVLSHWPIDRLLVTIISTFLFGLSMVLLPLCNDVVSSYALVIIFGANDSIYGANIMSFVSQQFADGAEDGSSLIRLSYTFCCMGVGALVGPVLAGNLIQQAGLDGMFYSMGGFPILSSIILVPYWAVLKYRNTNMSHTLSVT